MGANRESGSGGLTADKRPYRPSQDYTCANPACAKTFRAFPSDRVRERIYCSHTCAAQDREARMGHGKVTMECNTCGKAVTRPNSRIPGRNAYCNRECFQNRKKEPV